MSTHSIPQLEEDHRAVVRIIGRMTAEHGPVVYGPVWPHATIRAALELEQAIADELAKARAARDALTEKRCAERMAEDADHLDDAREIRRGMEAWLS